MVHEFVPPRDDDNEERSTLTTSSDERRDAPTGAGRSRLLLIPLVLYSFFLFLGSIPEPFQVTKGLGETVQAVRRGFYKYAHVKPGLGVFHGGRMHNVVDRNLCLIVTGVDERGALTRLYETFPNCEYPAVRVFNDTYNLVLSGLIRVGRLESLASYTGKAYERELQRARRWNPIDGIAQHYCSRGGSARVFVSAFTTAAAYADNQPLVRNVVLRGRDCAKQQRIPVAQLSAELEGGRPRFVWKGGGA